MIRGWRLFWRWRYLWVGASYEALARVLYVCPLPTLGVAIQLGVPDCRVCQGGADDGRHIPAIECQGCPDTAAHHGYRPLPLWARRRISEWWGA